MRREIFFDRQNVAPELGRNRAVLRLPGGDPQSSLHHQHRGIAEHEPAKSDQNTRFLSGGGGGAEAVIPGSKKCVQEMASAPGLARVAESFCTAMGRENRSGAGPADAITAPWDRIGVGNRDGRSGRIFPGPATLRPTCAAKTAVQGSAPPDQGKFEWQKTGVEPKTRRKV